LDYQDVSVITEDGLRLVGWFVPGTLNTPVLILHGTPGGRQDGLVEAAYLNQAGFPVLLGAFRAHDRSEGELISFGYHEQRDIAAWHRWLQTREGLAPERIGIFGESMGGGAGIIFTASHPEIRCLAAASAFALDPETIAAFIKYELNPPRWTIPLLRGLLQFWAEREAGFQSKALNTERAVGEISPRPVLIIHGGNDTKIGPRSGERLFQAARQPKEFWFVPEAGHVDFEKHRPEAYRRTLVEFFSRYLLN
jgi:fermentation-respiration switch protein FrsA (DUF1100 family)